MSIVNVDTEALKTGSANVKKIYIDNKGYYDDVSAKYIASCASFDSFKNALSSAFNNYTEYSDKVSNKLSECADALEEADNSIKNNITDALALIEAEIASAAAAQSTVSSEYVNPYDPDNLPSETLYDLNRPLTFVQNGKKVYETYCNIPLKYSNDLKFLILKMGYDAGFWYREDGVQMWGEDVMYANDIPEWGPGGLEDESRNPSNSTRRRGDKFYGTSGPGRIVGYGETSVQAHLGQFSQDGITYDETYDVYTAWLINKYSGNVDIDEYRKYSARYANKIEQYATRNVVNNPPLDPSQRYYQTNESWVNLFDTYQLTRDYIPDGVVNWNTDEWKTFDWESYFQQNNPERIKQQYSI